MKTVSVKPIPAILDLNQAIEQFRTTVSPLLAVDQEEHWDGVKLKDKETTILKAGLELVGHCIAILLVRLSQSECVQLIAQLRATGKAGLSYVNQGMKRVPVALIGGVQVHITTMYKLARTRTTRCGRKRKRGKRGKSQGQGLYPLLVLLGIRNGVSPLIRCQVSQAATQLPSFEQAKPFVAWLGLGFSTSRIRRISEAFCHLGLAVRTERITQLEAGLIPVGDALKGKRVAMAADGGRVNLRVTTRRGRKPKSGWPGYTTDWTEPKLFTIYVLDEQGNKDTHIDLPVTADGTLGGIAEFVNMLRLALHTLGIAQADVVVLLGDGAHWIWDHIPPLLHELGCQTTNIVQVLDFCHAVQHLYTVGKVVFGEGTQANAWGKKWSRKLKRGQARALVREIGHYLRKQTGDALDKLQTQYTYFQTHLTNGRLNYAVCRAGKLPIGSGAIESLVRQTINLRLKSCGKHWLLDNAEAFLHARCQWATNQWTHFCHSVLRFGLI